MTAETCSDDLDPLIHELGRLRICATLAATTAVEARTLKESVGMSDSALSKHLRRLAEAQYITQTLGKAQGPGRPRTWVSLTDRGRAAYAAHISALQRLASQVSRTVDLTSEAGSSPQLGARSDE